MWGLLFLSFAIFVFFASRLRFEEDLTQLLPQTEKAEQSGLAFDLKISSLAKDGQILELARNCAKQVVEADPMFEQQKNGIIRRRMATLFAGKVDWSMIS